MSLERFVDFADVRDFAGLEREVVTHERVEVCTVGLLTKGDFHRPPVILVEPRLVRRLEAHQDEVADQVGLAQLTASGVHALENQLRVVLVAAQRNVHDHELREALAKAREVGPKRLHLFYEEVEVLLHAQ